MFVYLYIFKKRKEKKKHVNNILCFDPKEKVIFHYVP